jgi:hypothetical protein
LSECSREDIALEKAWWWSFRRQHVQELQVSTGTARESFCSLKPLPEGMHTVRAHCIFENMQICKNEIYKYDPMKDNKMTRWQGDKTTRWQNENMKQ